MDGATGISFLSGWYRGFDLETGRKVGAEQYLLEVPWERYAGGCYTIQLGVCKSFCEGKVLKGPPVRSQFPNRAGKSR